MWFADIGLGLAWIALAAWVLVVAVVLVAPRLGRVAPRFRGPVVVGTGVAALLFAGQAGVVDTVADRATPGVLDETVWAWFVAHRDPAATVVMTAVSTVGGTVGMAVMALVGALVLIAVHRRREAVVVIVAAGGASVLVTGFKNLYDRGRPPVAERLTVETNAALPSGHALGSIVVLGVLAAVVVLLVRRDAVRVLAVAAGVAAIGTIGVSRLYLGVHWTTDVVVGWLLGGAWLALCTTVLVVMRSSSARRRPAEGSPALPS